jgi:CHASE2 domain-containing sensor protein
MRLKRPLRLGKRFWISFLVACAIVFFAEAMIDHLVQVGERPGLTQSIFNSARLYQWMVGAAREPQHNYTAVVKIDSENDHGAIGNNDICGQREQIARMVCRIGQVMPSVIVVDKFYGATECKTNEALRLAFLEVSRTIPVVIGRYVPDEGVKIQSMDRYYLASSLEFPTESGSKLTEGVANIDEDTRKLPLQWQLYPNSEQAQRGTELQWYDTLALAAAKRHDDNFLKKHKRLDYLLSHHIHPYISFLKDDDFDDRNWDVSEVLAGSNVPPAVPQDNRDGKTFCKDEKPSTTLLEMRGKVVVIGELDPLADMHESVAGKLPGYLVQANFIEALLDDRYYRPMPLLDYVYGFLFLTMLELTIILYQGHPIKLVLLITVLLVASVLVLWLTVKLLFWYVNPVPLGLTAVAVRVLGVLFHRVGHGAQSRYCV